MYKIRFNDWKKLMSYFCSWNAAPLKPMIVDEIINTKLKHLLDDGNLIKGRVQTFNIRSKILYFLNIDGECDICSRWQCRWWLLLEVEGWCHDPWLIAASFTFFHGTKVVASSRLTRILMLLQKWIEIFFQNKAVVSVDHALPLSMNLHAWYAICNSTWRTW